MITRVIVILAATAGAAECAGSIFDRKPSEICSAMESHGLGPYKWEPDSGQYICGTSLRDREGISFLASGDKIHRVLRVKLVMNDVTEIVRFRVLALALLEKLGVPVPEGFTDAIRKRQRLKRFHPKANLLLTEDQGLLTLTLRDPLIPTVSIPKVK